MSTIPLLAASTLRLPSKSSALDISRDGKYIRSFRRRADQKTLPLLALHLSLATTRGLLRNQLICSDLLLLRIPSLGAHDHDDDEEDDDDGDNGEAAVTLPRHPSLIRRLWGSLRRTGSRARGIRSFNRVFGVDPARRHADDASGYADEERIATGEPGDFNTGTSSLRDTVLPDFSRPLPLMVHMGWSETSFRRSSSEVVDFDDRDEEHNERENPTGSRNSRNVQTTIRSYASTSSTLSLHGPRLQRYSTYFNEEARSLTLFDLDDEDFENFVNELLILSMRVRQDDIPNLEPEPAIYVSYETPEVASRIRGAGRFLPLGRSFFHTVEDGERLCRTSTGNDRPLEDEVVKKLDLLQIEGTTVSTSSTSKDPVMSTRKHFKNTIGRARGLFHMLGRFEDFFEDPLKFSKRADESPTSEPMGPPPTRCSAPETESPHGFIIDKVYLEPIPVYKG